MWFDIFKTGYKGCCSSEVAGSSAVVEEVFVLKHLPRRSNNFRK